MPTTGYIFWNDRLHMNTAVAHCFRWTLLNAGLPSLAAIVTYWFAYLNTKSRIVDEVLLKAFSGGDNLIVASIIFAVLYFEIDEISNADDTKAIHGVGQSVFLFLCILFSVLFGAFKFYSLSGGSNNELNYAGAAVSIAALAFACACASLVKIALAIYSYMKEENGN